MIKMMKGKREDARILPEYESMLLPPSPVFTSFLPYYDYITSLLYHVLLLCQLVYPGFCSTIPPASVMAFWGIGKST